MWLFCLLAIAFGKAGIAQSKDSTGRKFKAFKVEISVGYASPQDNSQNAQFNGGALFAIEPKYAIIDPLAIGARVEGAVTIFPIS